MLHDETASSAAPDGAGSEVTRAQEGMLAVEETLSGRPSPFHVLSSAEITGPLDHDRLTAVLGGLVRRHPTLRTVFFRDERTGRLGSRVVRGARPRILSQELPAQEPGADAIEPVDRLLAPLAPKLLRPFAEPPIVFVVTAVGPDRSVLSLLGHHTLLDGWTLGLLWNQIASGYAVGGPSVRGGTEDGEAPGMEVFVAEERAARGPGHRRAVEARAALLAQWPAVTEIAGDLRRPPRRTFAGARLPFTLGEAAREGCTRLVGDLGVSRNVVLLAAWALAVARRAGTNRLIMGVPTLGRTSEEAMEVVGGATGLDAVACEIPDDVSVEEYVAQTARASREILEYSNVPFEEIVAELGAGGDLSRNPLVQFAFGAHNSVVPTELTADGLRFEIRVGYTGGTMYDAMLHVMRWGDTPRLELEYATDVLTAGEAAGLAAGFEQALADMAATPGAPLATLTTVTGPQGRLLDRWESGGTGDHDAGPWQLVEEIARRRPHTVAVRDRDGGRTLTYRQLVAAATAQSALLTEAGVAVGDRVALAVPRSAEEVVAVLAVLRTGAAYVGVDVESPVARLDAMLTRVDARVVLGTPDRLAALGACARDRLTLPVVDVLALPVPTVVPAAAPADPDRTAYVAFTSGTTGTPKGAMIPCRGVVRVGLDTGLVLPEAQKRFLRLAPLAFDASTLEIFSPLLSGGTVEVYPGAHVTPDELATFLKRHEVTGMFLTSGLFRLVADYRPDGFGGLVQIITGGDTTSPDHVAAVLAACPGLRVTNAYGPTECTTIILAHHMDDSAAMGEGALPIGRPLRGADVRVIGPGGAPVPPGGTGELIAFGDGVSSGYAGMPEETAAAFGTDGRRFYRTGDLVRWNAEGNLCFLGRRDRQVKIRGFRVETESIVAALRALPTVRDATVVVTGGTGDKQLVAGVVPEGTPPHPADLRASMARSLPSYALPHLWAVVDELPLLKHGKLDVAALTASAVPAGRTEPAVPAQESAPDPASAPSPGVLGSAPYEDTVAGVWQEVLGHGDFGRDDWFLDVGGDSLSLVRVHAVLGAALPEQHLTVEDLYACPTINDLGALFRSREGGAAPAERIEAVAERESTAVPEEAAAPAHAVTAALPPTDPAPQERRVDAPPSEEHPSGPGRQAPAPLTGLFGDPAAAGAPDRVPALRELAALLRSCDFDETRAARLLRARNTDQLLSNPARFAFFGDWSRPTPQTAPTTVLTSLFLLGRPVPETWVRDALPVELVDLLRELTLLERCGDDFLGTVSITPHRDRYYLSDQLFTTPSPQQVVEREAAQLVMPPHASSLLALDVVDGVKGSLLDAGCGSGFLALSAGPACERVGGFDLNPRGVDFSRANAVLNGSTARFEVADFAAAAGAGPGGPHGRPMPCQATADGLFDHLVFNSPTMPRVDGDAGEFGQSTARDVLRATAAGAPHLLRPGGTAHVLTVVETPGDRTAEDVVHDWLDDAALTDVTVREIATPYLSITRRQLRDGRLPGQSLLAQGKNHARQLMSALTARGTGAVVPVVVDLHLPKEGN
ncbi:amino acid adenylation domain-containing protein [Streptomyces sp. NPDC052052]|uniref:amino acid adenylation domain-containing protein n=1 Tax=Streptomyces sp. NPDC052052 TaxID=3154756 RepID=UPI0034149F92